MRVLVLADEMFASRERTLLTRLEVGLADEGVRTIHAVPETSTMIESASVFTQSVTYAARGWAITRGARARDLVRRLEGLVQPAEGERLADLVHVFGGSVWDLGLEIAGELGATAALEVWRMGLVAKAAAIRPDPVVGPCFFAPGTPIERALLAEGLSGAVRLTTWGVHTPSTPRQILASNRAMSIMCIGTGREPRFFHAAFEGALALTQTHPDLMVFMDAQAGHLSGVWEWARKRSLSHHLTLIEDFEARRDLLLQGDMLVLPEIGGEARTIVLDAMGTGMLVIAMEDPNVTALIDTRTARLVREPLASLWASAYVDVIGDPCKAQALVASAREYVRVERRASDHVAAVIQAYSWATSAERAQRSAAR